MKNILLFAVLGLVSGFLSWYSFGSLEGVFLYSPGWIFGGVISLLLYVLFRKNILWHILFVLISTVAFYAAFSSFFLFEGNSERILFMTAGFVGSFILAIGLRLMYPIPLQYLSLIVGVGALSGPLSQTNGIFPVWQTTVAIAIGYALSAHYKKQSTLVN